MRIYLFCVFCLFVKSLTAQIPIAVWHFDEMAGLFTKESASGAEFALRYDFPKNESEYVAGVSQNAIRLNGYASWVEGNLATPLPTDEITVTAWVAPEVAPFSSAAIFTNVAGSTGVFLGMDNFGRLEIGATVNGFFTQKISSQKVPNWTWSHLALTVQKSSGKMRGYLNGELVAEQNVQPGNLSWDAAGAVKMGKHHNSPMNGIYETGLFCGLIDEVKIFDKSLSANELQIIFQNEKPNVLPDMTIPAARFSGDPHRPIFHAIPPANWMNEPHGLFYHDGLYHIFYQKNGNGPYWGRLNWGHQTSPDLVVWTEQKVALSPDAGGYDREGCWSGCAMEKDGKPFLMYTGVDGGTAQMCLAEANADATEFTKFSGNPVVATPPAPYTSNDFRDPYIWSENGVFYMIIGSGLGGSGQSGGAALLYKSTNLTTWQYLDVLHKGFPATDNSGIFWEVPMFLKLGDHRVLTVQPVPQAGQPSRILYWTGTFENENFTADSTKPKLLEPGDNLLGVTTTTDPAGNLVAIGIIPDILPGAEQRQNGWANLMSLPRVWSLSPDGKTLRQKPLPALEKLRSTNHHFEDLTVAAGQSGFLPGIGGRHLEIQAKIDPGTATRVGITVAQSADNTERTRIFWEVPFGIFQIERSNSSINFSAPKGNVSTIFSPAAGQLLDLHVFLDGSVLEVFINEELALSTRIFPEKSESIGLDVFTQGGTAIFERVDIWEMKNMNDPTVTTTMPIFFTPKNAIEKVFPNPTTGDFLVEINLAERAVCELQVYDALGKIVASKTLGSVGLGSHIVPFSQFGQAEGHYFLQLLANGRSVGAARFIKN